MADKPPRPPVDPHRRLLLWFGGGAAALVAVALVVIVTLVLTGNSSPLRSHAENGPDRRPLLAKLCPPPTSYADPSGEAPPAPPGPRTADPRSGISYAQEGDPWEPWDTVWSAGTLKVAYRVGQHFTTEVYGGGNEYQASILSGSVPATANDGTQLDLKCTGQQVAADARVSYYPQPNTIEMIRDEAATLGGRPAWVSVFRLHFQRAGLKATDELVGIAMIDVGRPEAAVLYVSVPGTHRQFDPVVERVLNSVRPTG